MRLLTEEQQKWCRVIGEFAKKELEPVMYRADQDPDPSKGIPMDAYAKAFRLGLNAFGVPKRLGGDQVDLKTAAVIYEELGYYDSDFSCAISTSYLALKPLLISGTEDQTEYYIKHMMQSGFSAYCLTESTSGSDAGHSNTTAVYDPRNNEFEINGEKCYITNGGEAGIMCVFAAVKPSKGAKNMSCFIVERKRPGVSVTKYENKCGFRTASTCTLKFDRVRVPAWNLVGKVGDGYKMAMRALDQSRAFVGAIAVGMARRAMDEAISFLKDRYTFGRPVIERQGVQWMLAEMEVKIQSSRQMVIHCVDLMERKVSFSREAAICKYLATENAMDVCTNAMQLMGGTGYMRGGPVEKLFRDIKAYCIFEGTNQIQKIVISHSLLDEKLK